MTRVLLAGESWSTTSVHTKGFDSFTTSHYEEGGAAFLEALADAGHSVAFLPNHLASRDFPSTAAELEAFDVVVLSDIGANTLLLPARTFVRGQATPNRLRLLADWVATGGALLMVGGYLSFQGIESKANYANTPLAQVLPVEMERGDDREETPQGARPQVVQDHPVTQGLEEPWPDVLGYQRLTAKAGAQTLVEVDGRPLLVVGQHGDGRVMAFASDMGPHWLPDAFLAWPGYARLWQQSVAWLAATAGPATQAAGA